MANTKSKADLDRELNEYTRQLAYPEIQSQKYPNITNLINPYVGRISDQDAYNALGEKSGNEFIDPYTDAQRKAGKALAEDIYKTTDPLELGEKIKKEKNLTAGIQLKVPDNPTNLGAYNPSADKIELNPRIYKEALLDTIIHETGHAADPKNRSYSPREYPEEGQYFSPEKSKAINQALKDRDLYKLSDIISTGHFAEPRSHTINELLNKTRQGMAVEGMRDQSFETDPKFNQLDYIKDQLKNTYNYSPPEKTIWDKIKKALK